MTNQKEIVAVPVELLRRIADPQSAYAYEEVRALLPKPTPTFEMTAAQWENELEQDQRVQAWNHIWEHVRRAAPMPMDDERTATDYVLSLLPESPKPKPRLVAVNMEMMEAMTTGRWEYIVAQPNLLTLLDEAIDGTMNVTDWPKVRDTLKASIRTALGVTE